MAEQCIVCLGDLRDSLATDPSTEAVPPEQAEARAHAGDEVVVQQHRAKSVLRDTRLSAKRYRHHLPLPRADRA